MALGGRAAEAIMFNKVTTGEKSISDSLWWRYHQLTRTSLSLVLSSNISDKKYVISIWKLFLAYFTLGNLFCQLSRLPKLKYALFSSRHIWERLISWGGLRIQSTVQSHLSGHDGTKLWPDKWNIRIRKRMMCKSPLTIDSF